MADINSGLPVRTQLPGQVAYDDVIVKIGDGTTPSQLLGVDAAGKIIVKLNDAAGTALTSQANGAQQALDVMTQSAGPVSPGTAAAFSDLIGGQYNATLPTLTDTQQSAIQLDSSGRVLTVTSNFPTTVDTNYGVVGANTIRTASQIGNATGAADFNFGAASAQTLRVASLIGNATGAANFSYGAVGAQTLRVASQIGNATGSADFNYGAIGAQSLRVASQIGNATGAADYGNGATGAQTLRVAANLAVAGADVSATNPVPVYLSADNIGTEVNNYLTSSAVAAGASANHDYTVTALKTLFLRQIEATGSGRAKIEVQIETGVATGVFTTRFVQFNSTSETNMSIHLESPISVAAGVRVRVIRTNRDLLPQDLYSTISGQETP